MGHEGEYGPEYPGGDHPRAPESRLLCNVFEVEDILYETETERYEHREEHSFFHGIDEGERTGDDTKVLARFFHQGYDDVVKKHELQGPEYRSGDGDSSVREGCVQHIDPEQQEMKKGKEHPDAEDYAGILYEGRPGFPEILEEYPRGKYKDACRNEPDRKEQGYSESSGVIPLQKEREHVPAPEIRECHYVPQKEHRHY